VARDCYQLLLKRRPLNTSLSSFQEEIHREFGFFCTLLVFCPANNFTLHDRFSIASMGQN
jgi:hypothetical protein